MIITNYSSTQPGTEYRKRLALALQRAYSGHQYISLALSDAIYEFVHGARRHGLALDWVLVAIQDVIDAGILPSLCDGDRLVFSKPILRLAAEAYRYGYDATEAREPSRSHRHACNSRRGNDRCSDSRERPPLRMSPLVPTMMVLFAVADSAREEDAFLASTLAAARADLNVMSASVERPYARARAAGVTPAGL